MEIFNLHFISRHSPAVCSISEAVVPTCDVLLQSGPSGRTQASRSQKARERNSDRICLDRYIIPEGSNYARYCQENHKYCMCKEVAVITFFWGMFITFAWGNRGKLWKTSSSQLLFILVMFIRCHIFCFYCVSLLITETASLWLYIVACRRPSVHPLCCSQVAPDPRLNVPSSVSMWLSWILGSMACPSCLAWQLQTFNFFFVMSWKCAEKEKKLCVYNVWPHPSIFLFSSVTVTRIAVKCCVMCCLSFPKHTCMSCVTSWITYLVNFDVRALVFLANILSEYHPSFE